MHVLHLNELSIVTVLLSSYFNFFLSGLSFVGASAKAKEDKNDWGNFLKYAKQG